MKYFFQVIGRYINPYWSKVALSFIFNILSAVFSVMSGINYTVSAWSVISGKENNKAENNKQ